ncbi:succinate dehydrogenase, cytochrome b556 subunit [Sphingomonas morindae]|uniref:Succinate dehydrogenase cytochrome b556 subunit n=1 Tax=Sphingomonas morindae TaxID=1541170 RepID=A0ABY4X9M6_9SPHN|nr:succinate dehydrogenase, cytochrome b556 subunit [Sphingomonas morindae]USI73613.1 succinate dehydrogenase, cytochrome b556 subunit [Sphingomonas morindae]
MARNPARPLSPHLTIWKWGPHMLVSIVHRATGLTLAVGAVTIFTWWLTAAAISPAAYASFYHWVVEADAASPRGGAQALFNWLARLVGIGLSWALFQHMASGVRHLLLDTGAGYELRTNKRGALLTFLVSLVATLVLWAVILGKY